jgi:hypothetical protein
MIDNPWLSLVIVRFPPIENIPSNANIPSYPREPTVAAVIIAYSNLGRTVTDHDQRAIPRRRLNRSPVERRGRKAQPLSHNGGWSRSFQRLCSFKSTRSRKHALPSRQPSLIGPGSIDKIFMTYRAHRYNHLSARLLFSSRICWNNSSHRSVAHHATGGPIHKNMNTIAKMATVSFMVFAHHRECLKVSGSKIDAGSRLAQPASAKATRHVLIVHCHP